MRSVPAPLRGVVSGWYAVVALWYGTLPNRELAVIWPGQRTATFSAAIALVRRDVWSHRILTPPAYRAVVKKRSPVRKQQWIQTITLSL